MMTNLTQGIFLVLEVQTSHSPHRRTDHGLEKQVSFISVDQVSCVEGVIGSLDELPGSTSIPASIDKISEMLVVTPALLN